MKEISFGKRKICSVNYTRIISLPKTWLENAGIKEDDFVDVAMQEDGSLVIRPAKRGVDSE